MAFAMVEGPSTRVRKDAGLLPIRAALGASMVYHGLGKLRGEGPRQTGQMFEQIGIKPGRGLAVAAGASEVFAGIGTALGLFTRPAALAVLVTQAVATWKVHAKNGYDITKGGFEYNLALMAIAAGLLAAGPGAFSLHEPLEWLFEGRGAKKLFRKARPTPLLRFLKIVK